MEVQPSQRVNDGRTSPEKLGISPHDDVVVVGLDVLVNTDEIWQTLAQHTNDILCPWKVFRRGYDDRHEIVVSSDTSDDVAHNPLMGVLVVDRDMEVFDDIAHSICKIIVCGVLDVAVLRVNYIMASLCEAANQDLSFVDADGKLHFIPIVPWLLCAHSLFHWDL